RREGFRSRLRRQTEDDETESEREHPGDWMKSPGRLQPDASQRGERNQPAEKGAEHTQRQVLSGFDPRQQRRRIWSVGDDAALRTLLLDESDALRLEAL